MMLFLIDTSIFRKLLDHFPKRGKSFERIWGKIDSMIDGGTFISVDECFNELSRHFTEKNENYQWLHDRKRLFLNPTNEESLLIRQLFSNAKTQECIHQRNILENRPAADAYLVTKAKSLNGTVVTTENYKQKSAQIPNLCEILDIPCISYDDFMEYLSD